MARCVRMPKANTDSIAKPRIVSSMNNDCRTPKTMLATDAFSPRDPYAADGAPRLTRAFSLCSPARWRIATSAMPIPDSIPIVMAIRHGPRHQTGSIASGGTPLFTCSLEAQRLPCLSCAGTALVPRWWVIPGFYPGQTCFSRKFVQFKFVVSPRSSAIACSRANEAEIAPR